MDTLTIAIRGAGEMASGIAHRLFASGFTRIIMSEISSPICVRRKVSFCEAVYEKQATVEGVKAELIGTPSSTKEVWARNALAVVVDEDGNLLRDLGCDVLVDATMAKKRKESIKGMARFVIGVGPGFRAPLDADVIVESNRGHNLGRVFYEGEAEAYTGEPGVIAGFTKERVLRAPHAGVVRLATEIGETVKKGDVVVYVGETAVRAGVDGVVRGLIRPITVPENEKVGDIDPRGTRAHCYTVSEKARAIGGGVLEAILHRFNRGQA
jgi:xanthine dehydrogenase accessory factor